MLFVGVTVINSPPTELTSTPASGINIAIIAGETAAVAVLVGILVLLVFVGVMLLR